MVRWYGGTVVRRRLFHAARRGSWQRAWSLFHRLVFSRILGSTCSNLPDAVRTGLELVRQRTPETAQSPRILLGLIRRWPGLSRSKQNDLTYNFGSVMRSTVPPYHRTTVPPYHRTTVPPLSSTVLPNPRSQPFRTHHCVAVLAAPRLRKLRHVAERTVDPPLRRRMRIRVDLRLRRFVAL